MCVFKISSVGHVSEVTVFYSIKIWFSWSPREKNRYVHFMFWLAGFKEENEADLKVRGYAICFEFNWVVGICLNSVRRLLAKTRLEVCLWLNEMYWNCSAIKQYVHLVIWISILHLLSKTSFASFRMAIKTFVLFVGGVWKKNLAKQEMSSQ